MAGSITYGLNRIIASFQGIWLALRSMRYGCRARGFEEKWDGEFRDYGEDDRLRLSKCRKGKQIRALPRNQKRPCRKGRLGHTPQ